MRLLVRNEAFREDLVDVRRQGGMGSPAYWAFLTRWALSWFPTELVNAGRDLPVSPAGYETCLREAITNAGQNPADSWPHFWSPPVIALHDPDRYVDVNEAGEVVPFAYQDSPPADILMLKINLSYPVDLLIASITTELMAAKAARTKPGTERKRKRLDKTDFYLRVYDLAEGGTPFSLIGRSLKKAKSTVHGAYLTARLAIESAGPKPRKERKRRPLFSRFRDRQAHININPSNLQRHLTTCPTCKTVSGAGGWDRYCPRLQDYATDHVTLPFLHHNPGRRPEEEPEGPLSLDPRDFDDPTDDGNDDADTLLK